MNTDKLMSKMMDTHQKTAKAVRSKSSKATKGGIRDSRKRVPEPTEPLDPENEKIRPTLVKLCAYVEWMKQEIQEIKEDMETKTDLSSQNNLSLKLDNLEGTVNDLSLRLDDLE